MYMLAYYAARAETTAPDANVPLKIYVGSSPDKDKLGIKCELQILESSL
jgi:hypothetical protein